MDVEDARAALEERRFKEAVDMALDAAKQIAELVIREEQQLDANGHWRRKRKNSKQVATYTGNKSSYVHRLLLLCTILCNYCTLCGHKSLADNTTMFTIFKGTSRRQTISPEVSMEI